MNPRIARLIRDTAAQLHALLRQTVIDAMLDMAQPAASTHAAPRRGIGRPRNVAAIEAAKTAVAEGLSSREAARRFGAPQRTVLRRMIEMKRGGCVEAAHEPSATQRAVARVAAGESQSAAARAEGIDPSGVCAAIAKARLRGEFTGRTFRIGRPAKVSP